MVYKKLFFPFAIQYSVNASSRFQHLSCIVDKTILDENMGHLVVHHCKSLAVFKVKVFLALNRADLKKAGISQHKVQWHCAFYVVKAILGHDDKLGFITNPKFSYLLHKSADHFIGLFQIIFDLNRFFAKALGGIIDMWDVREEDV